MYSSRHDGDPDSDDFSKYFNQYRPKHKYDMSPTTSSSYYSAYSNANSNANPNTGIGKFRNHDDFDTQSSETSSIINSNRLKISILFSK